MTSFLTAPRFTAILTATALALATAQAAPATADPANPDSTVWNSTVSTSTVSTGTVSTGTVWTGTVLALDHPMGSQIRKHEGGDRNARSAPPDPGIAATVAGIDVSGWQGNVDWAHWWNQGKRFAYVKATEGTGYRNPYFAQQYNGSYTIGMIRGAYHFALPDRSSGAAQANFFVDNGGGWSRDGKTLPGVADLEYNPYGATCYGLSQARMADWITDFSTTYRSRTGRDPVFYTSTSWWSQCVGTARRFAHSNPLWVARYSSAVGALPYDWTVWTFWQWTSSPLDQNHFNGAYDRLRALANG